MIPQGLVALRFSIGLNAVAMVFDNRRVALLMVEAGCIAYGRGGALALVIS